MYQHYVIFRAKSMWFEVTMLSVCMVILYCSDLLYQTKKPVIPRISYNAMLSNA